MFASTLTDNLNELPDDAFTSTAIASPTCNSDGLLQPQDQGTAHPPIMKDDKKGDEEEENEDEDEDEGDDGNDGDEEILDMPPPWSPKLFVNRE